MSPKESAPITVERIAHVVRSQDADWTRTEICKALDRKKTSHMIRMIESAVEACEINRKLFIPDKGRPYFVYSYLDSGLPFWRPKRPIGAMQRKNIDYPLRVSGSDDLRHDRDYHRASEHWRRTNVLAQAAQMTAHVTPSSHFPPGWEHYDSRSCKFKHDCECCGVTFLAKKRTGVKFCSSTCRKRASNGHTTWRSVFVCKKCGSSFATTQPFQHPQYCSNACRQAAYNHRRKQA